MVDPERLEQHGQNATDSQEDVAPGGTYHGREATRCHIPMHSGIYAHGAVEGVDLRFTINTGVARSLISTSLYKQIPEQQRPTLSEPPTVFLPDGSQLDVYGCGRFNVKLGDLDMCATLTVADIDDDIWLGADVLKDDPEGPVDLLLGQQRMILRRTSIPIMSVVSPTPALVEETSCSPPPLHSSCEETSREEFCKASLEEANTPLHDDTAPVTPGATASSSCTSSAGIKGAEVNISRSANKCVSKAPAKVTQDMQPVKHQISDAYIKPCVGHWGCATVILFIFLVLSAGTLDPPGRKVNNMYVEFNMAFCSTQNKSCSWWNPTVISSEGILSDDGRTRPKLQDIVHRVVRGTAATPTRGSCKVATRKAAGTHSLAANNEDPWFVYLMYPQDRWSPMPPQSMSSGSVSSE